MNIVLATLIALHSTFIGNLFIVVVVVVVAAAAAVEVAWWHNDGLLDLNQEVVVF